MATTLACPECMEVAMLGTLERVLGVSHASIQLADDGSVDVENGGETTMYWDDSTTVGVVCRNCEWEYTGDDWATELMRVPSVPARIAGALAIFDADPDAFPSADELGTAASEADADALADPRVRLLTEIVTTELRLTDANWLTGLEDIFSCVAEHTPGAIAGALAEPTGA